MAVKLKIASNVGEIDLTKYLDVEKGKGMEPGDPSFTEKIFAHSLLKVGGTLALENLKVKEQIFPLKLSSDSTLYQNVINNPSFEHDVIGQEPKWWEAESFGTVTVKTHAVQEGQAKNGKSSFRLVLGKVAVGAGAGLISPVSTTHSMPITAGKTYYLSAPFIVNTLPAGTTIWIKCVWFKADGVTKVGSTFEIHNTVSPVAGNVIAPAEAVYARVEVFAFNGTAGEVALIDVALDEIFMSQFPNYFDGDTSRYHWAGTPGNSISENWVGKDGLANLIQEINSIITCPGAQVEWQDEGSSKPTYFDLVSGQFDDEYDYRLGQNNWLEGKLRLFSQPLGYIGQKGARALMLSGLATTVRVGTSPMIVFGASGLIDGDGPALLQAQVNSESLGEDAYLAFSVLPSSEYLPYGPAPSVALHVTSFSQEAAAPGATYAHYSKVATTVIAWAAPTESKYTYVGEQRVIVAARTPAGVPVQALQAYARENAAGSGYGEPLSSPAATVTATTSWQFYDLGVISVPSSILAAGENFAVDVEALAGASTNYGVDIGGLILLPEKSTVWLNTAPATQLESGGFATFDGVANAIRLGGNIGVPASGIAPKVEKGPLRDLSWLARGPIPQITPGASPPVFAVLAANINGNMNKKTLMNVNVLERTRYIF